MSLKTLFKALHPTLDVKKGIAKEHFSPHICNYIHQTLLGLKKSECKNLPEHFNVWVQDIFEWNVALLTKK